MTAIQKCSHSFPETSHKKPAPAQNCSEGKLSVDVMFIVLLLYLPVWFASGHFFAQCSIVTNCNCADRRSDDEYDAAIGTLLSVGGSVLRVLGERILDTYSGATQVTRERRGVISNLISSAEQREQAGPGCTHRLSAGSPGRGGRADGGGGQEEAAGPAVRGQPDAGAGGAAAEADPGKSFSLI